MTDDEIEEYKKKPHIELILTINAAVQMHDLIVEALDVIPMGNRLKEEWKERATDLHSMIENLVLEPMEKLKEVSADVLELAGLMKEGADAITDLERRVENFKEDARISHEQFIQADDEVKRLLKELGDVRAQKAIAIEKLEQRVADQHTTIEHLNLQITELLERQQQKVDRTADVECDVDTGWNIGPILPDCVGMLGAGPGHCDQCANIGTIDVPFSPGMHANLFIEWDVALARVEKHLADHDITRQKIDDHK